MRRVPWLLFGAAFASGALVGYAVVVVADFLDLIDRLESDR